MLHTVPHITVGDLKAAYAFKAYGTLVESMVLLHQSRQLNESLQLSEAGLSDGATVTVCSRLRGAGGDGGSTGAESRSCYLEMYAERKPDKVNPAEEVLARWTRCRLSGERLTPPCVADELGSLYNKEALVHALLNKTMPAALAHITSLKSVVTLHLDPVLRTASSSAAGPGPSSSRNSKAGSDTADFQCPVTGLEMNGRFPFSIHRASGVALSDRALREVPAACEELLGGKWTADDLIPVNPQGEELEKRQQQVLAAAAAEKARKRAKKAEKHRGKVTVEVDGSVNGAVAGGADRTAFGPAALALAGSKRPPAGPVAAATAAVGLIAAKKMKLPPGATPEVYKSLFSTGQPQMRETFLCRSTAGRGLGM